MVLVVLAQLIISESVWLCGFDIRIGWPSVSILWSVEMAVLICNFCIVLHIYLRVFSALEILHRVYEDVTSL